MESRDQQISKLPKKMIEALHLLVKELQKYGPVLPKQPHYGKLKGKQDVYHCHLNKGKPHYVVVWRVVDHKIQILEICYAGTHEKADYRRLG